jgi:glutamate synthase (NADPH/NADH) large chain
MSGGVAYVYDEDGSFASRCNTSMVSLVKVLPSAEQQADKALWHLDQPDEAILKKLVDDHHKWTGSLRARHIMDHWVESRAKFVKVFPNEYKRALGERAAKAALLASESKPVLQADAMTAKAKTAVPAK